MMNSGNYDIGAVECRRVIYSDCWCGTDGNDDDDDDDDDDDKYDDE